MGDFVIKVILTISSAIEYEGNGLSIAFLLAIKNVYGRTDGLDILMIDDLLQTIDSISIIAMADLLTQEGIGQIILSV
ncbi:MAG: hypothetical protein K2N44_16845 [Lachnospiraceae bacterium]|nr:hypothetical protein [Lachnospiraceae bacterium]